MRHRAATTLASLAAAGQTAVVERLHSCSSASLGAVDTAGVPLATFRYRSRLRYAFPFRTKTLDDFFLCKDDHIVSIAYTYRNEEKDVTVTLIPLQHFAHPQFFHQIDGLCCQHDSVLMEGRTPLANAPYSTIVPPRTMAESVRPPGHEDDEGWEPREIEKFWQPFSWGVKNSPNFTVVHASDKYDYERLPWWCSVRFNIPIIGSFAREKHCLDMIFPLRQNGYRSFAVPWGAAHMPIFNEMLLDNNFEQVGMCSILMFSRIDGDISEGQFHKLHRRKRRRQVWEDRLWVLAAVGVLATFYKYAKVEYTNGFSGE